MRYRNPRDEEVGSGGFLPTSDMRMWRLVKDHTEVGTQLLSSGWGYFRYPV